MIEERKPFQPVLRGRQKSKRMVSQGVNTNEEEEMGLGTTEGELREGDETKKKPVNIRMKRVTLDEFEVGPIEFGEVENVGVDSTQPDLALHLSTPSNPIQLVIQEAMELSARSNRV